jgi:hypothetical protein
LGADGADGIKLAVDEFGGKVAGRPIQIFTEDSAADPDKAIEKTRALVKRDGVQLILGPLSGAEGEAVKKNADEWSNTAIVVAGAAAADITMRGVKPNVWRTSYTGAQPMFPLGEWAFKNGYKRVAIVAEDYAFPYAQVGGFMLTYCHAGGKVVKKFWIPLGPSGVSEGQPVLDLQPGRVPEAAVVREELSGLSMNAVFLDRISRRFGGLFAVLEQSREPEPLLEVKDVHVYLDSAHVLQGASLALTQGVLGIIGRNGMGQTTLVRTIMGLTPARRGQIRFAGQDVTNLKTYQIASRGIAYVPQGRAVFPSLSVHEHLKVATRKVSAEGWTVDRVYQLFPQLAERRRFSGGSLSGRIANRVRGQALLEDQALRERFLGVALDTGGSH